MGSQAIAASDGKPVIPLTTACWAVQQIAFFQRERASIVFPPPLLLPQSRTARGPRTICRASAVGACFLWLFFGTAGDGQCAEGARAFAAPTEKGSTLPDPSPSRYRSLVVAQAAGTTAVERQILPGGGEKVDDLSERKQALEREQERDRAEALARALTSSLRAELNAVQSNAEAAAIKQRQALDQERNRADTLARELATLRTELDAARIAGKQSAEAIEVGIKQTQALEEERDKANELSRELSFLRAELDAAGTLVSKAVQATETEVEQAKALEQERAKTASLSRDLASVRAELDKARSAASETAKATAAQIEQKRALEPKLKQQQDRAEALSRELTSLRAELDAARAAAQEAARTVEATKIEQRRTSERERNRAETLIRELVSAQKQAEERSTRLAAAHAEVLQVTEKSSTIAAEQKQALASTRERADNLAEELASVRSQLEAATNRQFAVLAASPALISREPAADSLVERVAQFHLKMADVKRHLPDRTSVQAAASNSEQSSPPETTSTARDPAKLDPQVSMVSERSASTVATPHSLVDEERLLAQANALLRQADISGARPVLEYAVNRGSARAAFMLAETYDTRVLRSWRARGISGDPAKARELYERAQAGGIEDAKERIKTLK
jgi:hypothetical protein